MEVTRTLLPEVLVLEPTVFGDERGFFMESWNAKTFQQATGVDATFVQDNHSRSVRNVLRGIHYQVEKPQGKLVRVVSGRVWDVAVDLRRSSPDFGKWIGTELSAENKKQVWIPPGFGHGFLVLSETADVLYKSTQYWIAEFDRSIVWNDPDIAVDWKHVHDGPLLSRRDQDAPRLRDAEVFP